MVLLHEAAATQLSVACQTLLQAIQQLQLYLKQEQTTATLLKNLSRFPRVPVQRLQRLSVSTITASHCHTAAVASSVKNESPDDRSQDNDKSLAATVTETPSTQKEHPDTKQAVPSTRTRKSFSTSSPRFTSCPSLSIKANHDKESNTFAPVSTRRQQNTRITESAFATANPFSVLNTQSAKRLTSSAWDTRTANKTIRSGKHRTAAKEGEATTTQVSTHCVQRIQRVQRSNKYARKFGAKKGAPNCRTRAEIGPTIHQHSLAGPPLNVWDASAAILSAPQLATPTKNKSRPALNTLKQPEASHSTPTTKPHEGDTKVSDLGDERTSVSWFKDDLGDYHLCSEAEVDTYTLFHRRLTDAEVDESPIKEETDLLIQLRYMKPCNTGNCYYWSEDLSTS